MKRNHLLYLAVVLAVVAGLVAGPKAGLAAYGDYLFSESSGNLNQPSKVATPVDVDASVAYVTDAGSKTVKKYVSMTYDSGFSLSVAGTPVGIGVNSSNIFVGDDTNNCVWIYDANGNLADLSATGSTHKLGSGTSIGMPSTVAVSPSGHIFVTDGDNDKILIFNPNGSYNSSFGTSGSGTSTGTTIYCYFPTGIAMAESSTTSGITTQYFWIGDQGNNRVQKLYYKYGGGYITTPPTFVTYKGTKNDAFGSFYRVSDVVWDPFMSRLIVIDSLQMVGQVFDSSGNLMVPNTALNYSGGLSADAHLNVPTGGCYNKVSRKICVASNQSDELVIFEAAVGTPPTLTVDSPATPVSFTVCADSPYSVNYTAGDSDSAATVYLFFDNNTSWSDPNFPLSPGAGEYLIGSAGIPSQSPTAGAMNWDNVYASPGTYYVRGYIVDANGNYVEDYSPSTATVNDFGNGLNYVFADCFFPGYTSIDPYGDPDGDGLITQDEMTGGANPNLYDTDANGIGDGIEAVKGTDPNDSSDDFSSAQDLIGTTYENVSGVTATRFYVTNYGTDTAIMDLAFYITNGATTPLYVEQGVVVNPHGTYILALDDLGSNINAKGSVEIRSTSDKLVAAQEIFHKSGNDTRSWDGGFYAAMSTPATCGTTLKSVAYNKTMRYDISNYFRTWFYLKNLTNFNVSAHVDYYQGNGVWKAGLDLNFGPHASKPFAAHQTALASDKGYVIITSDQPLAGTQKTQKGTDDTFAENYYTRMEVLDTGSTSSTQYIPYWNSNTGTDYRTWINLQNPNLVDINVHLDYYATDGTLSGWQDKLVAASGSGAVSPYQVTPADWEGCAIITVTENGTSTPSSCATTFAWSPVDIVDPSIMEYAVGANTGTPGSKLIIPMYNKETLYRSFFTIQNTSASQVTAYATFYDAAGNAVATPDYTINGHGCVKVDVSTVPGLTADRGSIEITEATGSIVSFYGTIHTNPSASTVKPDVEDAAIGFCAATVE